VGKQVIAIRREVRDMISTISGKIIHPVFGLPGGVSRAISKEEQTEFIKITENAVAFGEFSLKVFHDIVLKNQAYVDAIVSEAYTHQTHYMGLVDENNKVNFYDGQIRVVDPTGKEYTRFKVQDYLQHIGEHVEPWSYIKFCYLKQIGWKGFEEGPESGVYAVAPLARLNVSDGMPTPKAQAAYEEFYATLGGRPVHHTLANHWARLVELLSAAEMMAALAKDPEITDPKIRNIPTTTPKEGMGVVEAPRGTLFHHFKSDEKGVITEANLIVATQNNAARIAMSVDRSARNLIKAGKVDDGILNQVEMAFRAYDPCHGCATHALPGQMPLLVRVYDPTHRLVQEIRRDGKLP
jgi:F420-non-reducing hydrogenase large subunit